MNATNYAAAGDASLSASPGVCWTAVSSAGTQWDKLAKIASGLSLTGKAALVKALVPILYCVRCI